MVQREKMMEKLWGDNFFDPTTKKWTKKHTGAASCKRGLRAVHLRAVSRPSSRPACPTTRWASVPFHAETLTLSPTAMLRCGLLRTTAAGWQHGHIWLSAGHRRAPQEFALFRGWCRPWSCVMK